MSLYASFTDFFNVSDLKPQSGNTTAVEKLVNVGEDHASETVEQVVRFLDENAGQSTGFVSIKDRVTTNDGMVQNADLGEYLSRPVRIANFTWNESDAVGTTNTFNPWYLFFNDARIKYKTNNFSYIQCDLKVKVVVNASPFYFGAMIMSYQPLASFAPNGYNSITNDAGTRYFIPYSQRPHLWIFPQNNEGGEMMLPFFFHKNWLWLQKASDFTEMGTLSFINYTTLDSANGATGAGVTVQVYAWAENVRISGPSVGLSMQAKTEYDGPVSSVASAVASAAKQLQRIPLIKSFATATEMGANALASGAHALGFTNVPIISDVMPYRPSAIAPMSTSEIGYPVEKLTLDPKNELSIDPGVVGMAPTDELSICHLVQKESYITTFNWNTSNVTDDILFSTIVAPSFFDSDNQLNAMIYMTPLCWLNYGFANWRGDIILRFRFVASTYHKGRVRISYDPTGYATNSLLTEPVSTTSVYTQIVDLGKDSDVEIRIPYQQATAWLSSPSFPARAYQLWSNNSTPMQAPYNRTTHNGYLTIRCLTALTAPVVSSTVKVMVFVRGAENFEFANPCNAFTEQSNTYSFLAPQAKEEYEDDSAGPTQYIVAGGTIHDPAPERFLVNFGEAIVSLRQVLRRSTLAEVRTVGNFGTNPIILWKKTMTRFPRCPGFDSAGVDSAKGIVTTTSNYPYNFVKFHPTTYISAAFIATRGSHIWHFNTESTGTIQHVRATRLPYVNATVRETTASSAALTTTSSQARFYLTAAGGSAGSTVTNQVTQAGLSVLMPNYSQFKFQSAAPTNPTYSQSIDGTAYDSVVVEVDLNGTAGPAPTNTKIWCYSGIGTDFNLHFFLNVPTLWSYSTLPAAN